MTSGNRSVSGNQASKGQGSKVGAHKDGGTAEEESRKQICYGTCNCDSTKRPDISRQSQILAVDQAIIFTVNHTQCCRKLAVQDTLFKCGPNLMS